MRPGVVVVTKFCRPGSRKFSKYIDYIDRDEAVREKHQNEFDLYMNYMENPEKSTGLFTNGSDHLSLEEKRDLKAGFQKARDNESLMWQTVISFDNEWLSEQGLYDAKKQKLDEAEIKRIARKAVQRMLEKENLQSAIWSGAIHYNTDNIHIHVAITEPFPTRIKKEYVQYEEVILNGEKRKVPIQNPDGTILKKEEYIGRFQNKSIEACKSVVVNEILKSQESNRMISQIIRKNILEEKYTYTLLADQELAEAFLNLYRSLPNMDRKMWNYNSNIMAPIRGKIDELCYLYLQKYHQEEYKQLLQKLKNQQKQYELAYGKASSDNSYVENKMNDLYTRLGNAILKECKEYDRQRRKQKFQNSQKKWSKIHEQVMVKRTLQSMKRALKSEWEKEQNERVFKELKIISI